ncbi:UNVERIFIED_CONTAM: hypothetical protein K2H54_059982 [Gekko kuhli]
MPETYRVPASFYGTVNSKGGPLHKRRYGGRGAQNVLAVGVTVGGFGGSCLTVTAATAGVIVSPWPVMVDAEQTEQFGVYKVFLVGVMYSNCVWVSKEGSAMPEVVACQIKEKIDYSFSGLFLSPVDVLKRLCGNQRELARQKNMKKTQEQNKGKRKEDALSASQRKQRDSEIMQQKQKAADEKKSLQTGAK